MRLIRHQATSLFAIALLCTMAPLALEQLGFCFQSLDLGGAGDNFAGYYLDGALLRIDLILAFSGTLGLGLYLGLRKGRRGNRLLSLLTMMVAMSGVMASIQIIETPYGGMPEYLFRERVYEAAQLSGTAAAAMLLAGCAIVRLRRFLPGHRAHVAMGAFGAAALAVELLLHDLRPTEDLVTWTHVAALTMIAVAAVLLMPELRRKPWSIYVLGLLAGSLPLMANQIYGLMPGFEADASAVNRAALLQWCAYLIPLLGLSNDLTRDASEQTREQERAYLRRVIDAIPDPIYVRDTEGRYRLLNNAGAFFLGGTSSELEGRLITELDLDSEFVEQNLAVDQEILTTGLPRIHRATEVADAQGNQLWLQMVTQPLASAGDAFDQVLGVANDVTRLKEAEAALALRLRGEKTLRRCLALLVRSAAENFDTSMRKVLQMAGEFCEADSAFIYEIQRAAGTVRRVCLWEHGKSPSLASYPLQDLRWLLPALAAGETVVVTDTEQRRRALTLNVNHLMLAPVFSRDGTLWGAVGAHCPEPPQPDSYACRRVLAGLADLYTGARDRVEAETDLQHAKEIAEASATAKGEFLANMSHEIRTPLNAVIGLADILRGLDPTPEQGHYVTMINQAGNALLGLINDILDFSKIEAGQLQLDPVEVDLPPLLAEVVDMMAYHAQQQGLELVYHLSMDARLRTTVDPVRLKQVLLNLLNNAIKFTESGHVALRVSLDNDQRVRFVVADTGIGIAPEKLSGIFDKFTQADASHTRKYGGTGLGLAICHSLVTMMGGDIEVASKPGRGTLFSVTLPLAGQVPDNLPSLPDQRLDGQHHLSVMLDFAARESLSGYLADLGVTGLSVSDPLAVEAQLGTQSYDFMLVDGQLDSLLLETVRNAANDLPADRRPHLLLVTPLGDERDSAELVAEGWSAVLHKPVRRPTLRRALHAACNPRALLLDELEDEGSVELMGVHVLLVEDNIFNQKVATRLLETLGCRVTLAENGERAVAAVTDGDFDLVLMDCQMPVMDGLEATRHIRALDDARGDVPVVAMTANVVGEHRDACLAAGMNDFASKPINKKTLREVVARWVREGAVRTQRPPVEV